MPVFYAEVAGRSYGGGWGIGSTRVEALRTASRALAMTPSEAKRGVYFVLEFPDGAQVSCASDVYGGWRSDVAPLAVVAKHGTTATDDELLGRVTDGPASNRP